MFSFHTQLPSVHRQSLLFLSSACLLVLKLLLLFEEKRVRLRYFDKRKESCAKGNI
jgi:hypothetical protein